MIAKKKKPKKKKQKTLSALKKIAWSKLSLLIRIESADDNGICRCYTCGAVKHFREMQAGHAIGGRHMGVLFDEEIIRTQCVGCNIMLRGNYPVFAARLIRDHGQRVGLSWFEGKIADSRIMRSGSRIYLMDLIDGYDARLATHKRKHLLNS